MFSILRPSLIYTDISPDVVEHDEDHDAEEWSYSDRTVYRGALDLTYRDHGIDVYWLYDDSLQRIGLAEHESDNHSIFRTLWFYDTPFGTLLQEPDWVKGGSLFEKLSPEAYQDLLDEDFETIVLHCNGRIVTPTYIKTGLPDIYVCETCNTRSFTPTSHCSIKKSIDPRSLLFMDESYVLYTPPSSTTTWKRMGLRYDAFEQPHSLSSQQQQPPEQTGDQ